MRTVDFSKMSGCGNDFIVIDNRSLLVDEHDLKRFIVTLCRRKISVGSDGLILIEKSDEFDFKWRFFNSDGSQGEMCGNGARCAARYAYLNGIAKSRMVFKTDAGPIRARINGTDVMLRMPTPVDICLECTLSLFGNTVTVSSINTGVPHVVMAVSDIAQIDVVGMGRAIRNHGHFAPAGTNVNFAAPLNGRSLAVRTYERGVEDETLACGTGAVASALITACKENLSGPLTVHTQGGKTLQVYFERQGDQVRNVHLEGEARLVYQGRLNDEAWT